MCCVSCRLFRSLSRCSLHPAHYMLVPRNLVPPLSGLCNTTWWALCHHAGDFVPPLGGLCATTRWALCHTRWTLFHHLVGFVPPRGGLCATTRWALCFLAVGRVPPHGGLGASTRWALCHHVMGSLGAAGTSAAARVLQQLWLIGCCSVCCSSLQPTPAPLPI